jgi:hypothetical protein
VVVDYAALADARVNMAFSPFGILAVDPDRTVFRQVPLTVRLRPGTLIRQRQASELLHDRRNKTIAWQASQPVTADELARQLQEPAPEAARLEVGPRNIESLNLPGAELQLGPAEIRLNQRTLIIRLVPE